MKRNFFIAALPRSRTTWIANALTHGQSFCYHDGVRLIDRLEDMPMLMMAKEQPVIGNADTSLLPLWRDVDRMFPASSWVFLLRSPLECQTAFNRCFRTVQMNEELREAYVASMIEACNHLSTRALLVDWRDLDHADTGKRIWKHCVGDEYFDADRWHQLTQWNIQPIFKKEALDSNAIVRSFMDKE